MSSENTGDERKSRDTCKPPCAQRDGHQLSGEGNHTSGAVESAQVQDSTLVSSGKSLDPCGLACPLTGRHPLAASSRGKRVI